MLHSDFFQRRAFCVGAAATLVTPFEALAQSSNVYTFLVGYSVGGPSDTTVRMLQPALQAELGQPLIVENIPGAGGAIAAQKLLANGPSGKTFMFATADEVALTPMSVAAARYTPEDFRPVTLLYRSDLILVARPNFPLDIQQFVKSTASVTSGIMGPASLFRLAMDDLKAKTGVKSDHIPYKGVSNLITDLVGGNIDVAFIPRGGSARALLADGRVKALAVASPARLTSMPSVPTLSEVLNRKFEHASLTGVVMHKGTPEEAVKRAHAALEKIKASSQFRKYVEDNSSVMLPAMSLTEIDSLFATEKKRYRDLADAAGVVPQ